MSTDYSKKKNAELEDLLKARSLPHTGKKAELIERLKNYDAEQEAAKAAPADGAEDEIDWEDDAAVATDPPAAAAIAAGGLTQPPNPTAVPNQKVDIDPSKTSDLTVVDPPAPTTSTSEPATTEPTSAPIPDFTTNLPQTSLDAELSKRKARALRFGITETNDDALKALERAKKFGTGDAGDKAAVRGLDEALPERSRKRGRGGGGDGEGEEGGKGGRQGKRSKVRGGNPPRGTGRRERSGTPTGKKTAKGGEGFSEADRKRAEERKKRFAN